MNANEDWSAHLHDWLFIQLLLSRMQVGLVDAIHANQPQLLASAFVPNLFPMGIRGKTVDGIWECAYYGVVRLIPVRHRRRTDLEFAEVKS